jgi:hypothetical protein
MTIEPFRRAIVQILLPFIFDAGVAAVVMIAAHSAPGHPCMWPTLGNLAAR